MKKDNYNDNIKRKLESIEPEFQDSDWEDMKAFMAIPPATPPLAPFYKPIGYGLAGIALLTSLFFNARQYSENESLSKNTIKESLQKTTQIFEKNTTPTIIYKSDTVYIDRFITKVEKVYVDRIIKEKTFAQKSQNGDESFIETNQSELSNAAPKLDKEIKTISKGSKASKVENTKEVTSGPKSNSEKSIIQNQKSLDLIKNEEAVSSNDLNQSNDQIINGKPTIAGIENNNRSFNRYKLESLKKSMVSPLKLDKQFAFATIFESIKAPIYKTEKSHFVIRIPKIDFKDSRYRFGISLDAANEQLAGGFTNELILSKHWGISAGLRLSNQIGHDYLTNVEYNTETKLDFRPVFAPLVSTDHDILNIKFQNYFLQLPLGINYRYPLRRDWNLLFTLGTDLDLTGRQYVTYDYQNSSGEFLEGKSTASIANPVFNNVLFSAGIEKKIGKYVFQALPYLSEQWRTSTYKRDDVLLGVKLKMMYQPKWY